MDNGHLDEHLGVEFIMVVGRVLSEYVWLSDALSFKRITRRYSEPIQTVLSTGPNRTWKTIETVLNLYFYFSDRHVSFP